MESTKWKIGRLRGREGKTWEGEARRGRRGESKRMPNELSERGTFGSPKKKKKKEKKKEKKKRGTIAKD